LADKLMTFSVIVCITIAGIIPLWAVILFFCKEMLMGLGALSMYRKVDDVIPSNYLGKASTATFFIVCLALMLFPQIPRRWATVMISFALALTVAAALVYLGRYLTVTGKHRPEKGKKCG
jgi:cardiolipin synthase